MNVWVERGEGKFCLLDGWEIFDIFNASGIADMKFSAGMFKYEEMSVTLNEIEVKDESKCGLTTFCWWMLQ